MRKAHLMTVFVGLLIALPAHAALVQINATGTSQPSPGGGSVTTTDWTLIYDDVSNDGLLQIEEIVSFSGTTVTTALNFFNYDTIVGSPPIEGVSTSSGGFPDCCWWFTGTVTEGPQDGWFPRRWTYSTMVLPDTPETVLGDLLTTIADIGVSTGFKNSLEKKIENALATLIKGNPGACSAATVKLNAFINSVEAQRNKKLSSADADALIDLAQLAIGLLEGA